jgi:hypothetical protein
MDNISDPELKKQFESLPLEVQKAISGADLPTKLQEIVKNNKLMIDQAGDLQMETMLVLLGLEPLESFVSNLMKNVGLSSIQASVIAHDVNESIFKNIRETLKKINDSAVEAEKAAATQPAIPTKETVLAGIEQPSIIKNTEGTISISSLSNKPAPENHPEMAKEGIEIKINNILPEIAPKNPFPSVTSVSSSPSLAPKPSEPFHINISPVANIVETKMTETVVVPKETIIVPQTTKLPEKPKPAGDPYREPIM